MTITAIERVHISISRVLYACVLAHFFEYYSKRGLHSSIQWSQHFLFVYHMVVYNQCL